LNRKAISLMSGGLDSAIATKLIIEQGVEVVGLHFTSPFASRRERERGLQVVETARELGIRLLKKEKGPEYMNVLLHPKYGYGKNMNPCIDCRIFMLRMTKTIMDEERAGFVITGEVLGQRPMSQRRGTIELIEKESGMDGLILRPLSAKLFPPSLPEIEGIVDRERLLGIAGRGRSAQYSLVAAYSLKEYSCPGGGCLLTDRIFSGKLRELMAMEPGFSAEDIDLLNLGRHFRLPGGEKLVLGRNESENFQLLAFSTPPYTVFQPLDFKGPTAVLKGEATVKMIETAVTIMAHFSKKKGPDATATVSAAGTSRTCSVSSAHVDIENLLI
jgi:tRNA-uridine 2-sulfurtransferase